MEPTSAWLPLRVTEFQRSILGHRRQGPDSQINSLAYSLFKTKKQFYVLYCSYAIDYNGSFSFACEVQLISVFIMLVVLTVEFNLKRKKYILWLPRFEFAVLKCIQNDGKWTVNRKKSGWSFLSVFSPLYLDVEIPSRYCGWSCDRLGTSI